MKFIAISLLFFGLTWVQPATGDSVNCSEPPGGRIRCPGGLTAICVVNSGKVYGKCVASPESATPAEMQEFAERELSEEPLNGWSEQEIRQILSGEEVSFPEKDINIRMSIPAESREGLR